MPNLIYENFLLRWTLANIAGWSIGLTLGSWILSQAGSGVGLILGGTAAGSLVGLAQWLALRVDFDFADRRWLVVSAAGGAVGALPAYIAAFSIIAGRGVGLFIIGAVFGGLFGALQSLILGRHFEDRALWWIAANVLAGGLCGWLSMTSPFWLPVCCSFGPVTFGLVTGYALKRLRGVELDF
jgi:hypothetical protein